MPPSSAAQHADDEVRQFAEGRADEFEGIKKAGLVDGAGMAHPAKPVPSVICADAAGADPAEGQIVLRDMEQRAVQCHTAGDSPVKDRLARMTVVRENIKRKWPRAPIDEGERIVKRGVGDDGQDRAEDFLAQQKAILGRADDQRRRDFLAIIAGGAQDGRASVARLFYRLQQTGSVPGGDDIAVCVLRPISGIGGPLRGR